MAAPKGPASAALRGKWTHLEAVDMSSSTEGHFSTGPEG